MNNIFSKMFYELEKQHDLMLVTIISEEGSAPRGTGSQMLVNSSGRVLGTIGGGAVEYQSEKKAVELLEKKSSSVENFELRKGAKNDIGMLCGGDVRVLFQYISAEDKLWPELAGALVKMCSERKKGWFIQSLDGSAPVLLGETGEVVCGAISADSTALMGGGSILTEKYFSMPLPIGERAIIFGGGHVAQALAPLLYSVGFRITVMDCREEYTRKELFPMAENLICGDYLRVADYIDITADDYIVIMTNGHSHDFEIQEQVLRGPFSYVGVIGSAKKTAAVNEKLRNAGVPEEGISKVHTPIGTKIKAVTPAEIAVSITGEMIYERALIREAAGETFGGCPMH